MKILETLKSLFSKKHNPNDIIVLDVFGNEVRTGDQIVDVVYNEIKRYGYVTIRTNPKYKCFDVDENPKKILSYSALQKLEIKPSKIEGYSHVYVVK